MSHSFTKVNTAEEVTKNIDLTGKTVVVTGVTSGLGYETCRVLIKRDAQVIGTGRTLEKARKVCSEFGSQAIPLACELSDLNSVKACADSINALNKPIDILICNAGMSLTDLKVKDGLEMQFFANHMGHFLLLNLLLERVQAAEKGRIVILSSDAIKMAPKSGIEFDNLDGSKGFKFAQFYGQSKLANLLTSNYLAERLSGGNVTVNALHPGVINTGLTRHATGAMGWFLKGPAFKWIVNNMMGGKSVEQGASTTCFVATSPLLEGVSGKFFMDNQENLAPFNPEPDLAKKLWLFSQDYIKSYL